MGVRENWHSQLDIPDSAIWTLIESGPHHKTVNGRGEAPIVPL